MSSPGTGKKEELDNQKMSYEEMEEFQEQERRKEAVDAVAEMLLVAEQIKVSPESICPCHAFEKKVSVGGPKCITHAQMLMCLQV